MAKIKGRDGVYQRRGKWCISYVGQNGKRVQRTTHETMQGARELRRLELARIERNRALGITEKPLSVRFDEFASHYLTYQGARLTEPSQERSKAIKGARLTAASLDRTKGIVAGKLAPIFGKLRLDEITREAIEGYVTDRAGEASPGSIAKELGVLHHLLDHGSLNN